MTPEDYREGTEGSPEIREPEGEPERIETRSEAEKRAEVIAEHEEAETHKLATAGEERVERAGGGPEETREAQNAGKELVEGIQSARKELRFNIDRAVGEKEMSAAPKVVAGPWENSSGPEPVKPPREELGTSPERFVGNKELPRETPQPVPLEAIPPQGRESLGGDKGKVVGEKEAPKVEEKKGKSARISTEDFLPPETRGVLSKLSERGRELASSLYRKTQVADLVAHARIAYNNKGLEHHLAPALKLRGKLMGETQKIAQLERALQEHDSRITRLQERHGGALDPKVFVQSERDKAKLAADLSKARDRAAALESKLTVRNEHKERFETRRDEIAKNAIGRFSEKLAPHEAELARFRETKAQQQAEITNFRKQREASGKQLMLLQRELKQVQSKSERMVIRETMRGLKREIREADKLRNERIAALGKVQKKIATKTKAIAPFVERRNHLIHLVEHKVDTSVAGTQREAQRRSVEEVSRDREQAREARRESNTDRPREREVGQEGGPEHSINSLIAEWNRHFSSELRITPDEFTRVTKTPTTEETTLGEFLDDLEIYRAEAAKTKKTKLSQKKFRQRYSFFRKTIMKQGI